MKHLDKRAGAPADRAIEKGNHPERVERWSHQSTGRIFKGWRIRVPVFLLAIVGSVIVGIVFLSMAAPGRESASLLLNPSLRVDAFATIPNVTVSLNMIINTSRSCSGETVADCEIGSVADLYGTVAGSGSTNRVNPGGKILIISTRPAYSPSNPPEFPPESAQTTVWAVERPHNVPSMPYLNLFAISIAEIEQTQGESPYGAPIAEFRIPSVTEESNGSFFGHLPDIGWLSGGLIASSTESSSDCTLIGSSSRCETGSSSGFAITGLLAVSPSTVH